MADPPVDVSGAGRGARRSSGSARCRCPQVVQQPTALADEQQQATTAVVVVLVLLEVLGEVADAVAQQRDLHLGGTGVALGRGVLGDDLLLGLRVGTDRHARLLPVLVARRAGACSPGHSGSAAVARQPEEIISGATGAPKTRGTAPVERASRRASGVRRPGAGPAARWCAARWSGCRRRGSWWRAWCARACCWSGWPSSTSTRTPASARIQPIMRQVDRVDHVL